MIAEITLLREPVLKFWPTAVISLSVLLVASMVFVLTVLLCRIVKERESKHSTYKTRSRQGLDYYISVISFCSLLNQLCTYSGSIRAQGAVYHIRSQENLK